MPRTKGIRQGMRQGLSQRLSKLEAQEQERREWLKDEQKKLAALQTKRKAAELAVTQQRWMAVGRLVEEIGLPTDDLDALKEMLQVNDSSVAVTSLAK